VSSSAAARRETTVRLIDRLTKDSRSFPNGSLVMGVEVTDVYECAIDHPRRLQPFAGGGAHCSMVPWTLVIGPRPADLNMRAVQVELGVGRMSAVFVPRRFFETKRRAQPVDRGSAVFL
jgi:hypothetical protein